jgi:hypothetical protein
MGHEAVMVSLKINKKYNFINYIVSYFKNDRKIEIFG